MSDNVTSIGIKQKSDAFFRVASIETKAEFRKHLYDPKFGFVSSLMKYVLEETTCGAEENIFWSTTQIAVSDGKDDEYAFKLITCMREMYVEFPVQDRKDLLCISVKDFSGYIQPMTSIAVEDIRNDIFRYVSVLDGMWYTAILEEFLRGILYGPLIDHIEMKKEEGHLLVTMYVCVEDSNYLHYTLKVDISPYLLDWAAHTSLAK